MDGPPAAREFVRHQTNADQIAWPAAAGKANPAVLHVIAWKQQPNRQPKGTTTLASSARDVTLHLPLPLLNRLLEWGDQLIPLNAPDIDLVLLNLLRDEAALHNAILGVDSVLDAVVAANTEPGFILTDTGSAHRDTDDPAYVRRYDPDFDPTYRQRRD